MRTLTEISLSISDHPSPVQLLDITSLVLAAVAEHLAQQNARTLRKRNTLRKAASVVAEFKTSLQFVPGRLLDSTTAEGS